jgi:hypothetical protein
VHCGHTLALFTGYAYRAYVPPAQVLPLSAAFAVALALATVAAATVTEPSPVDLYNSLPRTLSQQRGRKHVIHKQTYAASFGHIHHIYNKHYTPHSLKTVRTVRPSLLSSFFPVAFQTDFVLPCAVHIGLEPYSWLM